MWSSNRAARRQDRTSTDDPTHRSADGTRPGPRPYLAYLAYLSGRARDKYGAGPEAGRGKSLGPMTTPRRRVGRATPGYRGNPGRRRRNRRRSSYPRKGACRHNCWHAPMVKPDRWRPASVLKATLPSGPPSPAGDGPLAVGLNPRRPRPPEPAGDRRFAQTRGRADVDAGRPGPVVADHRPMRHRDIDQDHHVLKSGTSRRNRAGNQVRRGAGAGSPRGSASGRRTRPPGGATDRRQRVAVTSGPARSRTRPVRSRQGPRGCPAMVGMMRLPRVVAVMG